MQIKEAPLSGSYHTNSLGHASKPGVAVNAYGSELVTN